MTTPDPALPLGAFSISLAVKDLSRSLAFYEVLGFRPIAGAAAAKWLILRNGTTTIGLFQDHLPSNTLTFNPGGTARTSHWPTSWTSANCSAASAPPVSPRRLPPMKPPRARRTVSWSIPTAIRSCSTSTSEQIRRDGGSGTAPLPHTGAYDASQDVAIILTALARRTFDAPLPSTVPVSCTLWFRCAERSTPAPATTA